MEFLNWLLCVAIAGALTALALWGVVNLGEWIFTGSVNQPVPDPAYRISIVLIVIVGLLGGTLLSFETQHGWW